MAPTSILIVGCGIAGPVLASFLLLSPVPAADKPHITILERAPTLRNQGQNVDIRGAGVTIVRKLGLERVIRASTTDEAGIRFVDARDRTWGQLAADRSGRVQTGTADIEILRGTLARICYARSRAVSEAVKRAGGRGIEYVFGDTLQALAQDGDQVHVVFAKRGERRRYDIVVGADGLQSRTRKLAFGEAGESERIRSLDMYCAFFSMPRAKTDSLWARWFHAPGRRAVLIRPGERADQTSAVVSVISDSDERLKKCAVGGRDEVKAQKALLHEYFHDVGWESKRIIHAMYAADDFYYDMVAQIKMDHWSKGRVVLLGDAGYCGSPISGMGTTLALSGAYNLAGALTRHPNDFAAAFAAYEMKMRPVVERAQTLLPGAPHIINPHTAWGIFIMHVFFMLVSWSGLGYVLAMFTGPPAKAVPVEEYGFRSLPESSS